jgi:hypothetical protein
MTFRDDRPFRVADAVRAGRSRASVDSRRFEMPFHGLRSPLGLDDFESRVRTYSLRMRPDAAFTAVTAARLWGMPLPAYIDESRLHVSVPHGSPRPRSRPESLSRVLFVTSGIPEPVINHLIPELGVFLDLAWLEARFGYEYQGGHHVGAEQHASDVRRQERVHDVDWLLMEATKFDLFDQPYPTVARVRARLESRGMATRRTNPPIWAIPRR